MDEIKILFTRHVSENKRKRDTEKGQKQANFFLGTSCCNEEVYYKQKNVRKRQTF